MDTNRQRNRRWFRAWLASAALAAASHQAAAQQDLVVQLKDDPYRRVVFENPLVRVWEVRVPIGESTPFHEHRNDQVSIRINSTMLENTPKGGLLSFTRDFPLEAGSVSFAEYTGSPYVHKITPKGPNPHHVVEAELLGPRRAAERSAPAAARAGFEVVLDKPRIRASRVIVEPGQTAELATGPNSFVVVVKGGAAAPRDLKAGDVQWYGEPSRQSLRNNGSSRLELVEIEVRS